MVALQVEFSSRLEGGRGLFRCGWRLRGPLVTAMEEEEELPLAGFVWWTVVKVAEALEQVTREWAKNNCLPYCEGEKH